MACIAVWGPHQRVTTIPVELGAYWSSHRGKGSFEPMPYPPVVGRHPVDLQGIVTDPEAARVMRLPTASRIENGFFEQYPPVGLVDIDDS